MYVCILLFYKFFFIKFLVLNDKGKKRKKYVWYFYHQKLVQTKVYTHINHLTGGIFQSQIPQWNEIWAWVSEKNIASL